MKQRYWCTVATHKPRLLGFDREAGTAVAVQQLSEYVERETGKSKECGLHLVMKSGCGFPSFSIARG